MKWESYIGDAVGALVTRVFRMSGANDFSIPLFSETLNNQTDHEQPTADEIKQKILARLDKGGGEENGSNDAGGEDNR